MLSFERETYKRRLDKALLQLLTFYPYGHALWRAHEAALMGTFMAAIKLRHPILDMGCGDGIFYSLVITSPMSVAVDVSKDMLIKAKNLNLYEFLVMADARYMPFRESIFGTIISNSVIEHIQRDSMVFEEVSRTLLPNGLFIFSTVTKEYPVLIVPGFSKFRRFMERRLVISSGTYNYYDAKVIERKIKRVNISLLYYTYYLPPITVFIRVILLFFQSSIGRALSYFSKALVKPLFVFLKTFCYPPSNNSRMACILVIAKKMSKRS